MTNTNLEFLKHIREDMINTLMLHMVIVDHIINGVWSCPNNLKFKREKNIFY